MGLQWILSFFLGGGFDGDLMGFHGDLIGIHGILW
jgi:hypothetical protein